jgi:hypothetical protein
MYMGCTKEFSLSCPAPLPPNTLIFIKERKSDSAQLPKGLTVGTEAEQILFVFLALKGPAIVECGASCKIQPSK